MTTTPISLQDLRRKIYAKAKAEPHWRFWGDLESPELRLGVVEYARSAESPLGRIGPISLGAKQTGERSAGDPHATFDVAGAGNVMMAAGLRATAKAVELPPEPNVGAPVLDPTKRTLARVTGRTRVGLPNHLIRSKQNGLGDRDFESPRSLEVDQQLELGRLLDWQIAWLGALPC